MMRVIFLLLVSSIALQSKSQTWNNYLQKRFKSYGIWADSVLLLPSDTTINKAAKSLAVKNGNLYIANGTYWTEISGGSSVVDSLDKLYLKLTGGIVTGTVDIQQPLSLGEGGVSRGRLNFFNEDNGNTGSLSSIPYTSNREWLLPDYDGTLTTEDSLRSKTDSLLNIINGRATFGDVRDVVNDSINYVRDNYVTLNTAQTITGAKTVTNNFKIKDDNGIDVSDTKLVLENARTATISDTIAVAPYILFSSKTFTSDGSGDYSYGSNDMQWRIRQTLAKKGYVAGQDSRLYFDYKNGNAGSWTTAVSISKDGVQGSITGIDQMTLGNYSGNMGKITFRNVGGNTAGVIQAVGNVLRVSDASWNGKIEFFNGIVYYGGSATSTGSQLSSTGWAFAKNSNTTFTASALLHLDKNRSTAGNAPIKFTLAGAALLTTPERGALEAMPYRLHFTDSSNERNTLAHLSDVYKTPMNVADSNYTVEGNEIIIGYTGQTEDRTCTLPNPASHAGKSLTLFAKGMNDYDLTFVGSYKPKNLNDAIITSVKGDLPKHGVDVGSAIEGVSMKLVSFNNEWIILNYFTHYK